MTRPKRLYKSDKGYYYIEKGKKVFVKVPKGVTDKQISRVNIRDIYIGEAPKRVKRRKRKKQLTYGRKVYTGMNRLDLGGISYFVPERQIKEIPDQIASNIRAKKVIEDAKDTTVKKLTDIIDNITRSKQPIPAIEEFPTQRRIGKQGIEPVELVSPQTFVNLAQQGKPVVGESGLRAAFATSGTPSPTIPSPLTNIPTGRLLRPKPIKPIQEDSKEDTRERLFKGMEDKPVYSKPSRQQYQEYLKKGESGLMPSLRNPIPEKAVPSSFSATTRGKQEVAGIPKSEAEIAREEARRFVENPSGGDIENGLYSDEVETIARKRLKYYVPVIANDETDELMKYVKRGDKEFAFIVNTDDSDEGGRHWRCIYIDNRDDYPSVEWYDPLTEMPMPKHIATACKKIAMKMNPEVLFKFKSNAIRQQSKMSSRCGIHCVRFLEDRHEGVSFPDATGYTQFIDEMKKGSGDIDGSDNGEKEVSKKIPTYSSYI